MPHSTTQDRPGTAGTTSPRSFADLGVPAEIARKLVELGITAPFPIQELTVEAGLAGRDLSGKAPTGSGKTLAFSIPVAARVGKGAPGRPRALLLVPTRELAAQVKTVLAPLAAVRGRTIATIYGGTDIRKDVKRLRQGVDIMVACPGRLADLVRRGDVKLSDVELVVLDEADRMADMGFLPEVKRLLDACRTDRQTLLFSATLDGDVDELVRRYQRDPVRHEVAQPAEARGDVRHVFWPAERPMRRAVTAKVLREMTPAIVFTRTKRGADRLARQLAQDGIATAAIHGDRTQRQREKALKNFTDGSVTTLVATDVAARGIHVDDVAVVVHYDLPADHKDYVHRSGRTGRAGAEGVVVSFVGDEESTDVDKMQIALDLPRGLHHVDVDLLTTDDFPTPTLPHVRPHRTGGIKGKGGGQRSNAGRGNGAARGSGGQRGRGNGGNAGGRGSAGGGNGGGRSNGGQRSGAPKGGARSASRRQTR
ncbi:DEAD/DEAH box helicase [Nitriliruptor alkaliphilus]|uniref:DEAD/DEAH box helicase n=1 Tax=Nitriliruptor alkaliphilus TaxID=427918 RepID=UPI0009F91F88|nr:DEAD/DEAH box helicase [Nitriliruptor alkaliphilus]